LPSDPEARSRSSGEKAMTDGDGSGNASKEFLDWLSSYDHGSAHHRRLSKRQEGTGTWILQNEELNIWWESTSASIWCSGIRMHSIIFSSQTGADDKELSGSRKDNIDARHALSLFTILPLTSIQNGCC
jgi:hypothetical protein